MAETLDRQDDLVSDFVEPGEDSAFILQFSVERIGATNWTSSGTADDVDSSDKT